MTDFIDPYLDPTTHVLKNKLDARTPTQLQTAEGDLAFAAAIYLLKHPPAPTADLSELKAIHRELFLDVYEWAGLVRTVDIRKRDGATFFVPVSMIERAASFSAEALREDNMLVGMNRTDFVERLAHHYDQFNYIHPFRDGNGRAQRVFWNRIARDAGWELDWRGVHGNVNDEASRRAAEEDDVGPLREMFAEVVRPAHDPAFGEDWRANEAARMAFNSHAPEGTDDSE